MIIDSHCHAWARWPYQPPVPDFEQRGVLEQLLFEMDANSVDRALIVCAQIDHNPDNNAYVAERITHYPGRFDLVADVDCAWSETYHQPGAADRLRQAARWPIKGITHYLRPEDDGAWFSSAEGMAFFQAAVDLRLIASISCQPTQLPAIREVARRFPELPILLHHLGHPKASEPPPYPNFQEILACARLPNMFIKLSGFAYATSVDWNFPYADTHWLVRAEYEHFGPQHLCWGSDYPVVRRFMTYRQSLEAFRTHCDFIPDADKAWILGQTLDTLLRAARAV
ncbi:MAG: amidohydrolase [Anaerolineae bacterium]|nr:amidohydrolase [Anaerolineae bacterium]